MNPQCSNLALLHFYLFLHVHDEVNLDSSYNDHDDDGADGVAYEEMEERHNDRNEGHDLFHCFPSEFEIVGSQEKGNDLVQVVDYRGEHAHVQIDLDPDDDGGQALPLKCCRNEVGEEEEREEKCQSGVDCEHDDDHQIHPSCVNDHLYLLLLLCNLHRFVLYLRDQKSFLHHVVTLIEQLHCRHLDLFQEKSASEDGGVIEAGRW